MNTLKLGPSNWMIVYYILMIALFGILIVPIFYCIYRIYKILTTSYTFYSDKMIVEEGFFIKDRTTIQYYRIKSMTANRPIWHQLFGLGNFEIVTSEKLVPYVLLYALPDWSMIDYTLTTMVEREKKENSHIEFNHYAL